MDRFFVVITVQVSYPNQVITGSYIITETDPQVRYNTVYETVCRRSGLPENATAVLFYSVEKMPAT